MKSIAIFFLLFTIILSLFTSAASAAAVDAAVDNDENHGEFLLLFLFYVINLIFFKI